MQICMPCCLCQGLARNEGREHATGGHVALKDLCQIQDANIPGPGRGIGAGEVTGHASLCNNRNQILIKVTRRDDAPIAIISLCIECDGTKPEPRHLS